VARPTHNHIVPEFIRYTFFLHNGDMKLTFPRSVEFVVERIGSGLRESSVRMPGDAVAAMPGNVIFSGAGEVKLETMTDTARGKAGSHCATRRKRICQPRAAEPRARDLPFQRRFTCRPVGDPTGGRPGRRQDWRELVFGFCGTFRRSILPARPTGFAWIGRIRRVTAGAQGVAAQPRCSEFQARYARPKVQARSSSHCQPMSRAVASQVISVVGAAVVSMTWPLTDVRTKRYGWSHRRRGLSDHIAPERYRRWGSRLGALIGLSRSGTPRSWHAPESRR
jgi:hypothetical protein